MHGPPAVFHTDWTHQDLRESERSEGRVAFTGLTPVAVLKFREWRLGGFVTLPCRLEPFAANQLLVVAFPADELTGLEPGSPALPASTRRET